MILQNAIEPYQLLLWNEVKAKYIIKSIPVEINGSVEINIQTDSCKYIEKH